MGTPPPIRMATLLGTNEQLRTHLEIFKGIFSIFTQQANCSQNTPCDQFVHTITRRVLHLSSIQICLSGNKVSTLNHHRWGNSGDKSIPFFRAQPWFECLKKFNLRPPRCRCPCRPTRTIGRTGKTPTSLFSARPAWVTTPIFGWPRRSMVSVYYLTLWILFQTILSPGKECKICTRPFTIFRWCPGAKMRFKKTEVHPQT